MGVLPFFTFKRTFLREAMLDIVGGRRNYGDAGKEAQSGGLDRR